MGNTTVPKCCWYPSYSCWNTALNTHHPNPNPQPHVGAEGRKAEGQSSLGSNLSGSWISIQNLMAIHLLAVEVFLPGPRRLNVTLELLVELSSEPAKTLHQTGLTGCVHSLKLISGSEHENQKIKKKKKCCRKHIKANNLLLTRVFRGNPLICLLLRTAFVTFRAESWKEKSNNRHWAK